MEGGEHAVEAETADGDEDGSDVAEGAEDMERQVDGQQGFAAEGPADEFDD